MKVLLSIALLAISLLKVVPENPIRKTGHKGINSIEFKEPGHRIIKQLTEEEKKGYLKSIKYKFFGSSGFILENEVECEFVGKQIFSNSNRTSSDLPFNYDIVTLKGSERFFGFTGNMTFKEVLKIKNTGLEGSQGLKFEYTKKSTESVKETRSTKMVIPPFRKYTLRERGKALLSNGAIKKYVFGIPMKKGMWEVVIVETSWFELVEEKVEAYSGSN